jgi:transcriptional regulator with XRE-family HTH domain
MRKAAVLVGISDTYINHVENGRIDLRAEIVGRLVKAYGSSMSEFKSFKDGNKAVPKNHLDECILLLKRMPQEKLAAIYGLLKNF